VQLGYTEGSDGLYDVRVAAISVAGGGGSYTFKLAGGGAVSAGSTLGAGNGYGVATTWSFQACQQVESTVRCGATTDAAATAVNANARVDSCVAGQPVTVSMVKPGSIGWSYEYSFRSSLAGIPGAWSEWTSDSKVPALGTLADSQQVAVRTTGMLGDSTFHNAARPQDLSDYWKTCG
jgi:hypothetical protein